ncbi:MAG: hypothetical protein NC201_04085 [Prevotella sp.]|nr:hypothetical protein [Bacteroides sp.]MCM1366408.1 hypothetical protein [Prevotella sp.]
MNPVTILAAMLWIASLIGCNSQEPEIVKLDIPIIDMTLPQINAVKIL